MRRRIMWLVMGLSACASTAERKAKEPTGAARSGEEKRRPPVVQPMAVREDAPRTGRARGVEEEAEPGGVSGGIAPLPRARRGRPLEADLGPGAPGPAGGSPFIRVTRLGNIEASREQEVRVEVLRRLRAASCLGDRSGGSYEVRVSDGGKLSIAGGGRAGRRCIANALAPMAERLLAARRSRGAVVVEINVAAP